MLIPSFLSSKNHKKMAKSQYLVQFLRYGPDFLHVILIFLAFKPTLSNVQSHCTTLMISRGWHFMPLPQVFIASSDLGLERGKFLFMNISEDYSKMLKGCL